MSVGKQTLLDGRYRLDAEIARGAIGVVWQAEDTTTGEPVAVKLLRPAVAAAPDLVAGFLAEAEILAGLDHPNIVRVRNLVTIDGAMALVMDLVGGPAGGTDLRRRLRSEGPLPPAQAPQAAAALADALAYLHARGISHGDLKPGNLLLAAGEPAGRVVLADFGVARRGDHPTGPTFATPEYVPAEVVAGNPPGPAADVYALGIVLYELVSGRSPFRGGSPEDVLRRHGACVAVPTRGMPAELWSVIEVCLHLDPGMRPPARDLVGPLLAAAATLDGIPASSPLPADAVTYWPRSTENTAPIVVPVRRVDWVPAAAPVSPATPTGTDVGRLVAVPVDGPPPAPQDTAALRGPDFIPAPPTWPAPLPPPPAPARQPRRVLIGVVAAIVLLLLAGGAALAASTLGGGSPPVTPPSTRPSSSTPSAPPSGPPPSSAAPEPSASPSPEDTPAPGGGNGNPPPRNTPPPGPPGIGSAVPSFPRRP